MDPDRSLASGSPIRSPPMDALSPRRSDRVAATGMPPTVWRPVGGFPPAAGFFPALMLAPFPIEEKERLAVELEPRDEGPPFRPRDEIDELHREVIFNMSVLFGVGRDDPVRIPKIAIPLRQHDEVGLLPEGDERTTVGESISALLGRHHNNLPHPLSRLNIPCAPADDPGGRPYLLLLHVGPRFVPPRDERALLRGDRAVGVRRALRL